MTVSKFTKSNRRLLSGVHVLHKTWDQAFSRRSCATTAMKWTKKRDVRAKLLFCQSEPIAFLPLSLLKLPFAQKWLQVSLVIRRPWPIILSIALFKHLKRTSTNVFRYFHAMWNLVSRWKEVLRTTTHGSHTQIQLLVQHMPEVAKVFGST